MNLRKTSINIRVDIFYIPKYVKYNMAILGIFTGDGFTKQKYEELRKEVDWEHKHPTGAMLILGCMTLYIPIDIFGDIL
jgi:hypothetical protein